MQKSVRNQLEVRGVKFGNGWVVFFFLLAQIALHEELPFGAGTGRRGGKLAGRWRSGQIGGGEGQVLLNGKLPFPSLVYICWKCQLCFVESKLRALFWKVFCVVTGRGMVAETSHCLLQLLRKATPSPKLLLTGLVISVVQFGQGKQPTGASALPV